MSPSEFYIDAELIKRVPSEMLITELQRRMAEFVQTAQQVLLTPKVSPDVFVQENAKTVNPLVPVKPVTPSKFDISAAARELALRDLSGPEGAVVIQELEAAGDLAGAEYLRSLPGIIASMGQNPPDIHAIVQANSRHAEAAFIQPRLPPDARLAKNQPTEVGHEWWDTPTEMTFLLNDILPIPEDGLSFLRSSPKHGQAQAELHSGLKRIAHLMGSDAFLGHLPKPSLRVGSSASFRLLNEPTVIWRFLHHLTAAGVPAWLNQSLANTLTRHIEAAPPVGPKVAATVGRGCAETFRSEVATRLLHMAEGETDPNLTKAIKRQLRILSADLTHIAIPDEAPEGISDPRQFNPKLRGKFPSSPSFGAFDDFDTTGDEFPSDADV